MAINSRDKIKKLVYQSKYRGCKESEIIFINFLDRFIDKLTVEQIEDFEYFLGYNDSCILDWLLYDKEPPEEVKQNKIFPLIKTTVTEKQ